MSTGNLISAPIGERRHPAHHGEEERGMTPAMRKLLTWVWHSYAATTAPASLADALTVERLPRSAIPNSHHAAVTAFRHLRRDARWRLCRRFILDYVVPR